MSIFSMLVSVEKESCLYH